MSGLVIGVVGLAVLSTILGLVELYGNRHPRASCNGCALASVCEDRREDNAAAKAADRREACYVSQGDPEHGAPIS